MELQEYHVKRLFKKAGLPVLKGDVAYSPNEAVAVASKIGDGPYFLKAQVVDGNSCYGVLIDPDTRLNGCACVADKTGVAEMAVSLLGHPDWIKNASPLFEIQKLYVEEGVKDAKVLGSVVFRVNFEKQCAFLTIAPTDKKPVSFVLKQGLTPDILTKAVSRFEKRVGSEIKDVLEKTYRLFQKYGAVAVELKPIVQLKNGVVRVVDGRLVFDPNTMYLLPDLVPLIESRVGKEREQIARQNHFRYMGLKGNIACVVNGIGLGWATIDLIQRKGGKAGALLDIGTWPTKETVTKALRLVLSEPNVDGVLVNIFGGVTRCDLIAEGLIEASPEIAAGLPLVVRMDGMNAEAGQRMLFESHLPFIVKTKMDDAVRAIIKEIKEKR